MEIDFGNRQSNSDPAVYKRIPRTTRIRRFSTANRTGITIFSKQYVS
jgi:hypothetical protein